MKIAVFGAGGMGIAIAKGLYYIDRETEIELVDNNHTALVWAQQQASYIDKIKYRHITSFKKRYIREFSAVVSALPYLYNLDLATICIETGVPYFDLGGNVGVSHAINREAEKANASVFTDLGLAPGLVNIVAEEGYRHVNECCKVDSVTMYCGGLQLHPGNPLKYVPNWSIEGLMNEYLDDCVILKNGEILTVPGMSDVKVCKDLDMYALAKKAGIQPRHYKLESFLTSGGAASTIRLMKDRGVKNCEYRTIRFLGHAELLLFLLKHIGREGVHNMFESMKRKAVMNFDFVIGSAIVQGGSFHWQNNFVIASEQRAFANNNNRLSAMAKGTGYSAAAVVHDILGKDKMPIQCTYADVNIDSIKKNLKNLNIIV